jgi:hypothetical protein
VKVKAIEILGAMPHRRSMFEKKEEKFSADLLPTLCSEKRFL